MILSLLSLASAPPLFLRIRVMNTPERHEDTNQSQ